MQDVAGAGGDIRLLSPMWDRQTPPRAHTRGGLSHTGRCKLNYHKVTCDMSPCDHSACTLPCFARFSADRGR